MTTISKNCVISAPRMRDKGDAIPTDWRFVSVEDIAATRANAIVGGPFGSDLVSKDYVSVGVPVIRGQNMAHHYVSGDFAFVSPDKAKQLQANTARAGDLIFTQRGTLGQVSLVPGAPFDEYVVSQSQMKLELDARKASAEYVYQYFVSAPGQKQIIDSAIQTGVPHTNLGILKKYEIPFPPTLMEQEAIGEALSDADALIESLSRVLAKKRQVKQGAMQELLSGKKRLPGFDAPWGRVTIGSFTSCTAGGTPSTNIDAYWGGNIPWMSSGELHLKHVYGVDGRITDEGLRNSSTKWIPAGCVLIGLAGQGKTRGTVAMNHIPLCTNQSIAAILPVDSYDARFLYFNLDSRYEELRELSAGDGGRGGLNLNLIRGLEVPIPCLDEQRAIAQLLADMESDIVVVDSRLAKARAVKQGMMQELLTGRIRLVQPAPNAKLSRARFADDNIASTVAERRTLLNG
ncbi:Putative type-1 restriction enzyme [Paraburkholderia phenoliruptrix BR3459a]|uniref:Putative type-1 restriction enzyme n=1 Tax=Paraburkholderia phenoliruptrix BR3459a TaxID=1229205 RepID=K0DS20_9BURK|nr:Putative type-1 restriction enzyme [Paraburkholderia phenoliruptrix BR3459a]